MKLKSKCCKNYRKKGKACKRCPVMARLTKKQAKKLVKRYQA
jgi:hypothetical protein